MAVSSQALIARCRRLRHVRTICVRNLTCERSGVAVLPFSYCCISSVLVAADPALTTSTSTDETIPTIPPPTPSGRTRREDVQLGETFFTSSVRDNTMNPNWKIHSDELDRQWRLQVRFVISIYATTNLQDGYKTSTEIVVDCSKLEYVGPELGKLTAGMNQIPNFVFLELNDGYYTTPELLAAMVIKPAKPDPIKEKEVTTYTKMAFLRIVDLKHSQLTRKAETHDVLNKVEGIMHGDAAELAREQKRQLQIKRSRLAHLRAQLETTREEAAKARAKLQERKAELLPKAKLVGKSQILLLANVAQMQENQRFLLEKRNYVSAYEQTVAMCRAELLDRLLSVYRISPAVGTPNLAICHVELPVINFDGQITEDDAVATALGYVAHLVFMASRYLCIPLRYPLVPMSSRSFVCDDVAAADNGPAPSFPLYFIKGSDRMRFQTGYALLCRDIEQLLMAQGRQFDARSLLRSVQLIFPSTTPD